MKSMSGKELAKVLKRNGWKLLRVHDSHPIYGKAESVARLSVPIQSNQPLKLGLWNYLLNLAGIPEEIMG